MTNEEVHLLLQKYNEGKASKKEGLLIENWYAQYSGVLNAEENDQVDYLGLNQEIFEALQTRIQAGEKVKKAFPWYRLSAAAAVFLAVLFTIFYFFSPKKDSTDKLADASHLAPGKNSATLTLSNGKRIYLSDAAKGQVAKEAGVIISKTADGKVVYKVGISAEAGKNAFNTLTTAKGEQYMVELPDGSRVWLNAVSSLRYAVNFYAAGGKERRSVFLTGEAYFEIAKDKSHPFVVRTDHQELIVTGTHFNVNSYADEPATRTTLMEGSVKVAARTKDPGEPALPSDSDPLVQGWVPLSPGFQSVLRDGGFSVKQVDPMAAIDWKDGKFIMDNESLPSILRKISRWYNVDIEYRSEGSDQITFSGIVSRKDTALKLLKFLQRAGNVNFEVQGRKIIVY